MGSSEQLDVLVVGGTAAGGTAAIRAQQLGLRAAIIETSLPPAQPAVGWFHRQAVDLAQRCGLDPRRAGGEPFRGVTLHSPDFRRRISVAQADLDGWLLRCDRVAQALLDTAADAGAIRLRGTIADVVLRESVATVALQDGTCRRSSVLLIDDGPQSVAARLARLPRAGDAAGTRCVTASAAGRAGPGRIDVVLAAGRASATGLVARMGQLVQAALLGVEESGDAQLDAFLSGARGAGLFPVAGDVTPGECARPAGVALDMDAHVGKRCVLIGCAGGFVSAFNCDPLYPAMRSGWLAAEAAARAIAAPLLQDELASFDSAWRTDLADYLRRPNTDLSLLLPLVFNENLQMSQRVARAFLLGEKF